MTISFKRGLYSAWLILICSFAVLHALNLSADFPSYPPLNFDGSMYTDEGWWANAAIHAHLTGNWYPTLDYNPAPAVPVWPFLEWILFCFTGVTIEAARGLAIAMFFANLFLSYLLLRATGPRWVALLAVSLLVTSPFLYSFSRLAILEPPLTTLTLAALNLAVRLPRFRRRVWISITIGLLFALMTLTKTSAVFLLPALLWAIMLPLWKDRKLALKCAFAATGSSIAIYGLWMVVVVSSGMLYDYRFFLSVNSFPWPKNFHWPLGIFYFALETAWGADHILIPLAAGVVLGSVIGSRYTRSRMLLTDPVFGASVWAVVGYFLFMIYHCYVIPRYFAVVTVFCILVVAQGAGALLSQTSPAQDPNSNRSPKARIAWTRLLGWSVIGVAALALSINGAWTIDYAAHPKFTFVNAARQLTQYIDDHPNGKRLLVSISGDQIALVTNLPTLCDPTSLLCNSFSDPASELAHYQPGWYAEWDCIDQGTLEVIHTHFSLEQVASFRAFEDPSRQVLLLFKLHPLPAGEVRDPAKENLQVPLPGDKIDVSALPWLSKATLTTR